MMPGTPLEMPDTPFDDFAIRAESDVRGVGLTDPAAVDLGMEIWSRGLAAGINYARRMLDEMENQPGECVVCLQLWPPEAFHSSSSTCRECRSVTSWFRRRAVRHGDLATDGYKLGCRLIREAVGDGGADRGA